MIKEKQLNKDLEKLRKDLKEIATMPEDSFLKALKNLKEIEKSFASQNMDTAIGPDELEGYLDKIGLDVCATRIYYQKDPE